MLQLLLIYENWKMLFTFANRAHESIEKPSETNGRRNQCANIYHESNWRRTAGKILSTFTLTAVNCANKIIFQLALLVLSFFRLCGAVLYRCYYFIDKIFQPMNVCAHFVSLLACNVWENYKLIDYNMQNKRNCGRPYAGANLIDRLFSLLCHWKFKKMNKKEEMKQKRIMSNMIYLSRNWSAITEV